MNLKQISEKEASGDILLDQVEIDENLKKILPSWQVKLLDHWNSKFEEKKDELLENNSSKNKGMQTYGRE